MSTYLHSSGDYYQLTVDHAWQDVSEGYILWRLWRGMNERIGAGYGADDVGAKYLRYEGDTLSRVADIDDAIIVPGANLQNYKFWRALQEIQIFSMDTFGAAYDGGAGFGSYAYGHSLRVSRLSSSGFIPLPVNVNYNGLTIPVNTGFIQSVVVTLSANSMRYVSQSTSFDDYLFRFSEDEDTFYTPTEDDYLNFGETFRRFVNEDVAYGYCSPGDRIGVHLINDLLRVYSRVRMLCRAYTADLQEWGRVGEIGWSYIQPSQFGNDQARIIGRSIVFSGGLISNTASHLFDVTNEARFNIPGCDQAGSLVYSDADSPIPSLLGLQGNEQLLDTPFDPGLAITGTTFTNPNGFDTIDKLMGVSSPGNYPCRYTFGLYARGIFSDTPI
jgi:hypothetical protein